MFRIRWILLFVFFGIMSQIKAQYNDQTVKIDALKSSIEQFDWDRANSILQLIDKSQLTPESYINYLIFKGKVSVHNKEYDLAEASYKEAINLCEIRQDITKKADALYFLAVAHYRQNDFDAVEKTARILLKFKLIPDYNDKIDEIPDTYNILGLIAKRTGDLDKSIEYYEAGLQENLMYNHAEDVVFYTNLTNAYRLKQNYIKAAQYVIKLLKLNEKNGNMILLANSYIMLGDLYILQNNPNKCLAFLDIAEDYICPHYKEEEGLYHSVIASMGEAYLKLKDYSKAHSYFLQDSTFRSQTDDYYNIVRSNLNLGLYYQSQSEYKLSKHLYSQAEYLIEKYNFKNFQQQLYTEKAISHYHLQEKDAAIQYLYKVINRSGIYPDFEKQQLAYKWLSKIQKERGQTSEALDLLNQAILYGDSLQKQRLSFETTSFILDYENEKERLQFQKQQKIDKDKLEHTKQLNIVLAVFLLLASVIIYMIFKNYQYKKKYSDQLDVEVKEKTTELEIANQLLEKSNEELRLFYATIAHDLRYPILNVQSNLDNIEKEGNNTIHSLVRQSRLALDRLFQSFEKMMNFFRLEQEPLTLKKVEPSSLLKDILIELESINELRNLNIQIKALPSIHADVLLIRQTFINLILNAVKYTENKKNPLLTIESKQTPECVYLFFKNNGEKIRTDIESKIFQSFVTDKRAGHNSIGMGLFIVKRIMERHKGTVHFYNTEDGYTVFELMFPKAQVKNKFTFLN